MATSLRAQQAKLRRQNDRALEQFFGDVYGAVRDASLASMHQAAQIGLQNMVEQAKFSDYTGVLANSYQASIKQYGHNRFDTSGGDFTRTGRARLAEHYTGDFYGNKFTSSGRRNKEYNPSLAHPTNSYKGSNGQVALYTSYGRNGTSKISFKKNKQGRYPLRKTRGGKVIADSIWDRYKHGNRPPVDGYGRVTTKLRTAQMPNIRSGYAVIFANGAPYAWYVHNHFNKVYPTGTGFGKNQLIVLVQRNLKISIAQRKRLKKRGRR